MKFYWMACCLMWFASFAIAAEKQDYLPSPEDIRIWHLIPDLTDTLAIEPAIPKDFVALSRTGKPDICKGIYWGPRKVVENYISDPSSLTQPLIFLTLSRNTTQADLGHYTLNQGELSKVLDAAGLKFIEEELMSWGIILFTRSRY